MSTCCSTKTDVDEVTPKHHVCPENGEQYLEVPYATILQHIKDPWKLMPSSQPYYFCEDLNCEVVYFGLDNTIITKDQLRTRVGIKEDSDDALICYCFGVTKSQAKTDQSAKAFVIEQTKQSMCACTTQNPSGRCCLKDFPK